MSKKHGVADPTRLTTFDSDDKQLLRVVVETPKEADKFAFDPDEHIFELRKVHWKRCPPQTMRNYLRRYV
jgi:hypothetical protein